MYYSNDSCYGLPATSNLCHVLWQGIPSLQTTPETSVDPANLVLAQPSHEPIHPYEIPHNVASTHYNFEGYPAAVSTPHGPTQCSQSMGHTSGQCSVSNGVPSMGHSTMPVRVVSRGLWTCKWVLEDGTICRQTISEGTVSKHLAEHGIQRMHGEWIVQCSWHGCGKHMKRRGIKRHFREVHLSLKRKPCFPRTTLVTNKH